MQVRKVGQTWGLAAWLLLVAVFGVAAAPVASIAGEPASQPVTEPESQPTSTQSTTTSTSTSTSTTTAESEEEEPPEFLAIVGGRVHVANGSVIESATVLCKDGIIESIGVGVQIPDEATIVEADGMDVYPGLIACAASGIHVGGADLATRTNVFGLPMNIGVAVGITTAMSDGNAAKLTFGSADDDMLLKTKVFVSLRIDSQSALKKSAMRADFERVRQYVRELSSFKRAKADGDEDAEAPDKDWIKGKFADYLALMRHEKTAIATANRVGQIRPYVALATEFGFRLVLRGVVEGWIIADELARAGIKCIVTPRADVARDFDRMTPNGSTIQNASILHDRGVTVAVVPSQAYFGTSGIAGRDLTHLNMSAAFAVRGGMTNDDAIDTITISAARILEIDDRVGSLAIGKDADLIVCDGDLLSYLTQVHFTIVNGRVVYEKRNDSLFAHIRPDGEVGPVEFNDHWPKRLAWPDRLLAEPAADPVQQP